MRVMVRGTWIVTLAQGAASHENPLVARWSPVLRRLKDVPEWAWEDVAEELEGQYKKHPDGVRLLQIVIPNIRNRYR